MLKSFKSFSALHWSLNICVLISNWTTGLVYKGWNIGQKSRQSLSLGKTQLSESWRQHEKKSAHNHKSNIVLNIEDDWLEGMDKLIFKS